MEAEKLNRSVSRSIAVLQAVNRRGSLSMMEISRAVELPYPTVTRLVQTLIHEGLLESEPARKHYRATALVQSLSSGFRDNGHLVGVARPYLVQLTQRLHWPSVLSTRVGAQMVLRDSTHNMTSLVLTHYQPGFTMPILECAPGHVVLAYMEADARLALLDSLDTLGQRSLIAEKFRSGELANWIRADGYATDDRSKHTRTPGKTSSLSVPVFDQGQIAGTVSMVFFATTMTMGTAVERYLAPLSQAAAALSLELNAETANLPDRKKRH